MWNKVFLLLGLAWIALNIYFQPFFAWTTGIVRPWLMLHGYIPYRDFVWMRTPFDIFLLTGWFKLLGVSDVNYQHFIFFLLIVTMLGILFLSYRILPIKKLFPFLFFTIFLFPLFQNSEIGEILIGLFALFLFGLLYKYLSTRKLYLLVIAGLTSGICLITKQNSGALIAGSTAIIVLDSYLQKNPVKLTIKKFLIFIISAIIPIAGLILFYGYNKALPDLFYYSFELVLDKYNQQPLPAGFSRGDALWVEAAYLALLIPFLVYWKKTGLTIQKALMFPLFLIALFPSILPSYLSYRTFTSFPIASLLAGFNFAILLRNKGTNNFLNVKNLIVLFSFVSFVTLTLRFTNSYIQSVRDEGFHYGNFIKDYTDSETQTATWINKNTNKNEKIMSFSNSVVYLLSDRLPKNKYIDPFPYLLYPYPQTSKIFSKNPPRIMVIDERLFVDFPDLLNWPFYKDSVKENYKEVKRFENLIIYELVK